MHQHVLRAAVLFSAIALSLASTVATAAEAEMRGDQLVVKPRLSWPAYQLRVVAPGGATHEAMFLRGETLSVTSRQVRGGWVDGTYSYEITPVRGVAGRPENQAGGPAYSKSAAISESGSFRIQGGQVFAAAGVAEPGAEDLRAPSGTESLQTIPEDLSVQGSVCVGFDCTSSESFGFDTIRLKENNLRIKFDDTSSSAGFPANDWQLTANDSASGGMNKFSIEDTTGAKVPFTVVAGAPTNSFFVDSTGRIGLRTSTPVLDLHINTGNTPALRMEQNSSGGWGTQTWDIGANEANFFVRDVTGGSRLPFRIRPGAPNSSIDIAATGNVGIGTASPTATLDVSRAGDAGIRISNTTASGTDWDIKNNSASGRLNITDDASGSRIPMKISPGAANNLLRIGALASDTVDINGDLIVTGSITPDYVFEQGFEVPSIREHADFMWQNRHLPKMAPAEANEHGRGLINVGQRSQGMLEELEYAHIYIEQLHSTMQGLQQAMADKSAELQQLRQEIAAIKAGLVK